MLEMLDIGIENAVAYRLTDKISETDMKLALTAIKGKIERYGEAYIYQEVDGYTGVEFDAMLAKFKFLFENGIANISRIAVVTDKPWLQKIVKLEDKLFKNIDMQYFAQQNKEQAVEFLKESE